jgi:hypothetical protein
MTWTRLLSPAAAGRVSAAIARCALAAALLVVLPAVARSQSAPLASGSYSISCAWSAASGRVCQPQSSGAPRGARISRVSLVAFQRGDTVNASVHVGYGYDGVQLIVENFSTLGISTRFAGSIAAERTWHIDLVNAVGNSTVTATLRFEWALWRRQAVRNDFDGDGRSDTVFVDGGRWYLELASGGNPADIGIPSGWQWGGMQSHHALALGDYDGDGRTDRAIVDPTYGTWFVLPSSGMDPARLGIPWGWRWNGMGKAHQLALGDYDGDGRTDRAIVDPDRGTWFVLPSSGVDPARLGIPWGWRWGGMGPSHKLALGDFDGDGRTDRAVVDSALGNWFILPSSGVDPARLGIPWGWNFPASASVGASVDVQLAVGDYDGDGRSDPAVARHPANSAWTLVATGSLLNRLHVWGFPDFGFPLDVVAVGDYDGDGSVDPALQNTATGDIARLIVW